MFFEIRFLLFLFVSVLTYFAGGLVASMSLSELKTARKYVPVIIMILVSIAVGGFLFQFLGFILSTLIGLIVFVLLVFNKKIDTIFVLMIVFPLVLIFGNAFLIQLATAIFLFQGINDYEKYVFKKKRSKVMILKGSKIFIGSLIILLILFFVV